MKYSILNFFMDVGKFVFFVLAVSIIVILIVAFAIKTEDIMNKRECYEIYATDNVILKKCKKYFEKESDVK